MSETKEQKPWSQRFDELFADNQRCRVIPCAWKVEGVEQFATAQEAFDLLKDRLPADAHLGDIGYEIKDVEGIAKAGEYLFLVVWSKTFDVTPRGQEFPVMNLPLRRPD